MLQKDAEEQGRQIAGVEPRAAELERRMEEMQGRIHEKITMLVSKSEEHSSLIERSSSTVATFSERITSYEKEVKEATDSNFDSFKQEVEKKILDLFDTTEDQTSQIELLNKSMDSVTDQSNRTLEDVVLTQTELHGIKNIMIEDKELIVKRVAEQKEAVEKEVVGISARFDRLEAAQDHEVAASCSYSRLSSITEPLPCRWLSSSWWCSELRRPGNTAMGWR